MQLSGQTLARLSLRWDSKALPMYSGAHCGVGGHGHPHAWKGSRKIVFMSKRDPYLL